MNRIYLCLAHMSETGEELKYIKEAFDQNWVVPLGPNVDAFEKELEKFQTEEFVEKVGCIEVMDNVFIGTNVTILCNTRIGSNVIIGANSVVNKDLPGDAVYAGTPARRICSFDEYVEKHRQYSEAFRSKFGIDHVHGVDNVLAAKLREDFIKQREG